MTNPPDESTIDEAIKLRDRVVRDLESKSYEELWDYYATLEPEEDGWVTLCKEELPETTLEAYLLIGHLPLFRRRFTVEVTVGSDDGTIHPGLVPGVYFERFASGRLVEPTGPSIAVLFGVMLALLAVSLIAWLYAS